MDNRIDDLLVAAKTSTDPTVKKALDKLLFVTSLAHDKNYISRASEYYFHNGCTVTVPPHESHVTLQLAWNSEEMAVHAMEYQAIQFHYGRMLEGNTPLPGIYLVEDKNI